MNKVEIKIYLKSQRKPIKLIVDSVEQATKFMALFENDNKYVRYGNFIFDKDDFNCAIYNVKKF